MNEKESVGQGANDKAQAPPAQENNETSPAPAGGCVPRPCSAPSEKMWFAYLIDSETKEIAGKIEFVESYLNGRTDVYAAIPNSLIKQCGGIKENQRVVVTDKNPEELHLPWPDQPQPEHR